MERFVLALVCLVVGVVGQEQSANEERLQSSLFRSYNNRIRPQMSKDEPLEINLGYSLIAINDVSPGKGYMDLTGYLTTSWKDFTLQWNPEDYGDVDKLQVPVSDIWTPDIELYNGIPPGTKQLIEKPLAIVSHNGDVNVVTSIGTRTPCDVRSQLKSNAINCTLNYGSWTHNGMQLDVQPIESETPLDNVLPSGKWRATKAWTQRETKRYSCCPEPYITIKFGFQLTMAKPQRPGHMGRGQGGRRGGKPHRRGRQG